MKRSRTKSATPRLTPDAERLIALAAALGASGSLIEDRYWQAKLGEVLARLLDAGNENAVNAALDHLFQVQSDAYDEAIDQIESFTETARLEHDGRQWDVLLIAAPVVAWSKYSVPAGPLPPEAALTIITHLGAHVLGPATRIAMLPFLFSIDQLPHNFTDVRKLTLQLGQSAVEGKAPRDDRKRLPDTANMLADPRFLVAAAAVPAGEPLFRWQETTAAGNVIERNGRSHCLEQWSTQVRPTLAPLLTGCVFDVLLPEAFFVGCREADRRVRPYALHAATAFLENALGIKAETLHAVIAGFGTERVDEYRIAFLEAGDEEVAYGTLWPLYGREDDSGVPAPLDDIRKELRAAGIGKITELKELFPPEFCDDCGAPLFPTPEGEMVHAGIPDEAGAAQSHFH